MAAAGEVIYRSRRGQAGRGRAMPALNFPRGAKVYDNIDIPANNLASKKEVIAAKVPDLLGVSKAGWNASTLSEKYDLTDFFINSFAKVTLIVLTHIKPSWP